MLSHNHFRGQWFSCLGVICVIKGYLLVVLMYMVYILGVVYIGQGLTLINFYRVQRLGVVVIFSYSCWGLQCLVVVMGLGLYIVIWCYIINGLERLGDQGDNVQYLIMIRINNYSFQLLQGQELQWSFIIWMKGLKEIRFEDYKGQGL